MDRQPKTRTAIIHIGGPKTGSTSIQKVMKHQALENHHYIQVGPTSHSLLLSLIFWHDKKKRAPFVRREGWTRKQMDQKRAEWLTQLEQEIEATDKHIIFSSEALWGPTYDDQALTALRDFLARHVTDFRIIGYIRSPVSYLQSLFEQRQRSDRKGNMKLDPIYYRARFEKFDRVFGRDNVDFIHYDRDKMVGRDVVLDFAHRIGVELHGYDGAEKNTALSLQATSVRYAQKKLGRDIPPYKNHGRDTRALLRALGKLGRDRVRFGADLIDPVLAKCQDDIDWMERRLGQPIRDAPVRDARVISSEADLLTEAAGQIEDLKALLIETIVRDATGARAVARLADALRDAVSAR